MASLTRDRGRSRGRPLQPTCAPAVVGHKDRAVGKNVGELERVVTNKATVPAGERNAAVQAKADDADARATASHRIPSRAPQFLVDIAPHRTGANAI